MRNGVTSDAWAFASLLWMAVIHMMSSAARMPNPTTAQPILSLIMPNYRNGDSFQEGVARRLDSCHWYLHDTAGDLCAGPFHPGRAGAVSGMSRGRPGKRGDGRSSR